MRTRIIFSINNLDTAGMKYVLATIVLGLDRSQFDPVVLVYKKTGTSLERKLEEHVEIHEAPLRFPGRKQFLKSLSHNVKLLKGRADLCHSFDYSSDWNEALVMKLAGIKYVAEKTNLSMDSYRWKIKLRLANHIVCLSTAQKKQLENYATKLTVIPTGIDLNQYMNATPVSRGSLGLNDDDMVLVCVAHLVEVKGHRELTEAFAKLKDEYPKLKIVYLGRGDKEYEEELKQLVINKSLEGRVIFSGDQGNVAGYMKMANGKILATRNQGRKEAFGAVLVEAMAAGLPVIATRSGGPEDIVVDGVTGWLVEGHGTQPLVEGMRKFMNSNNRWEEMGKQGQDRAVNLFGAERMIAAYSSLYKKLTFSKSEETAIPA